MKSARIPKKPWPRLTLAFHLTAFFLSFTVHAARPFVTDDARVVDRGGCQLETFYKKQETYSGNEFWFLPACNPFGLEITVGGNRVEGEDALIVQGKYLLKPLEPNGIGFAASAGVYDGNPYVNGITSISFLDDRAVVHANLGAIRRRDEERTNAIWGIGLEALLYGPRLYGILETYAEQPEKPTLHYGLRIWIVPNRFQFDLTHGQQKESDAQPERRFNSVGIRILW